MDFDETRPGDALAPPEPRKVLRAWECPDCNVVSKSAGGLGRHRYAKHGYRSPKPSHKKEVQAARGAEPPGSVKNIFEALVGEIHGRGELDKELIDGLKRLAKAVAGLRQCNLQTRQELREIHKLIPADDD